MAFNITMDLVIDQQPPLVQHLLEKSSAWVKPSTVVICKGVPEMEVRTLEQFSQALVNEVNQFIKNNRTTKHIVIGIQIERPTEAPPSLVVYRYTRRQFVRQLLFRITLESATK